ncbi:hypothetical protein GCM10027021_39300 [Dyella kyungheensis]
MVHAAGVERIGERAHDVLLPDQFSELAGAPLACEDLIGHSAIPWGKVRLCQAGRSKSVATDSAWRCLKRRRPCQPHPGTRIIRYRCSLPGLAEFTNYRRGGTDRATIETYIVRRLRVGARFHSLAERAGFEPAIRG